MPTRDPLLHLWIVLSRAYHSVEAHARADFARHDLTPGEFGALEALHHLGPLPLGELQRKILVSSGGITWVADRLEERGLLERVASPEDRRVTMARLTPRGNDLIERIFPIHQQVLERALSGLSESEARTVADGLRTLGRRAASLDVPHHNRTHTTGVNES